MKPCCRAGWRAVWHIEGRSDKHLAVPGLHFEKRRSLVEAAREVEARDSHTFGMPRLNPKSCHHAPLLTWRATVDVWCQCGRRVRVAVTRTKRAARSRSSGKANRRTETLVRSRTRSERREMPEGTAGTNFPSILKG